jgi:hypothetical protein
MLASLRDFAGLAKAGLLWERLSLFMDEKWLVGTSMVVEGNTEDLTTQGLLNVRSCFSLLFLWCVCGRACVRVRVLI